MPLCPHCYLTLASGGIVNVSSDTLSCEHEVAKMETDKLLQERGKTHGDFKDNAEIAQALRKLYRANLNTWGPMRIEHREALDMIACKLSRILSGQANFRDHWDDIAGYAKLASDACG